MNLKKQTNRAVVHGLALALLLIGATLFLINFHVFIEGSEQAYGYYPPTIGLMLFAVGLYLQSQSKNINTRVNKFNNQNDITKSRETDIYKYILVGSVSISVLIASLVYFGDGNLAYIIVLPFFWLSSAMSIMFMILYPFHYNRFTPWSVLISLGGFLALAWFIWL